MYTVDIYRNHFNKVVQTCTHKICFIGEIRNKIFLWILLLFGAMIIRHNYGAKNSGPSCSKLTMSLVNISLKL